MSKTAQRDADRDLDRASEQSFPASDPPAWSGAAASSTQSRPFSPPDPTAARPWAAPLLLRLTLAAVFFPHGAQKALGLFGGAGLTATLEQFETAFGLPAAVTLLVVAAEFLGSVAIAVGLLTRFSALAIAATMVGAVQLVHWQNGFFMNWSGQQAGEGFEFHLLAIGAALALALMGPGRCSIDARLWRKLTARRR